MELTQPATPGQIAMSVDFNPGGREDVKALKQIFADAYNEVDKRIEEKLNGAAMYSLEQANSARRWAAIAKTHLEEGQMAAVKAVTR